jgi:hypothetical protein
MNTSLVKAVPQGDFAEVSVLTKGWQSRLLLLVSEKRPIRYDLYPFPAMPEEVGMNLAENGYHDLILENDRWQHFLMPSAH